MTLATLQSQQRWSPVNIKKQDIGDLLDGREKKESVSEVRAKIAELDNTIACKPALSQAFEVISLADVYSTECLRRQ